MITPLPTADQCVSLLANATTSFSDIDSTVGDLKPNVKNEPGTKKSNANLDPLSTVDSLIDGVDESFNGIKQKFENEEAFEFVPMPPFTGLDANVKPKFKTNLEPGTSSTHETLSPNKGGTGSKLKLDPSHLLQASPVSPGSDDLEPLPFSREDMHEPFTLTGPIADDFLSLFDEISNTAVPFDECDTIVNDKSEKTKKSATSTGKGKTQPQTTPQYHRHYHTTYPLPPPGYAPSLGYTLPHHYQYPSDEPFPYHVPYERTHKTFFNSVKNPENIIKQEDVTDKDVICGRGGNINKSVGNKRFRKFVAMYRLDYLHADRLEKPALALKVLEKVKPGRFLVKIPHGYVECDDSRAQEKASQALREGAAKLRKEGYALPSQAFKPSKITLPNERTCGEKYSHDPQYYDAFAPPQKKMKKDQGEVTM